VHQSRLRRFFGVGLKPTHTDSNSRRQLPGLSDGESPLGPVGGQARVIGKSSPESNGASAATSAGASPSSSSGSPGSSDAGCDTSAGCSGGACAAAKDVVVLTVVRSCLWADGGDDDVWKVEIDRAADIGELKARIADLYEIPEEDQRLQRTKDPSDPCLSDAALIGEISRQPLYLLPLAAAGSTQPDLGGIHLEMMHDDVVSDEERESQFFETLEARNQEQAALVDSLENVTYRLHLVLEGTMDPKQKSELNLTLAALALAGDVQASAEVELFGAAGTSPFCLIFNGQPLPPDIPLHFAGIRDEDTLVLAAGMLFHHGEEDSDSDDSLDDGMLAWAGRG